MENLRKNLLSSTPGPSLITTSATLKHVLADVAPELQADRPFLLLVLDYLHAAKPNQARKKLKDYLTSLMAQERMEFLLDTLEGMRIAMETHGLHNLDELDVWMQDAKDRFIEQITADLNFPHSHYRKIKPGMDRHIK